MVNGEIDGPVFLQDQMLPDGSVLECWLSNVPDRISTRTVTRRSVTLGDSLCGAVSLSS